jgi:hypothetical protein
MSQWLESYETTYETWKKIAKILEDQLYYPKNKEEIIEGHFGTPSIQHTKNFPSDINRVLKIIQLIEKFFNSESKYYVSTKKWQEITFSLRNLMDYTPIEINKKNLEYHNYLIDEFENVIEILAPYIDWNYNENLYYYKNRDKTLKEIESSFTKFKADSTRILIETKSNYEKSESYISDISDISDEFKKIYQDYFVDNDGNISISSKIIKLDESIERKSEEINQFYKIIFSNDDSIRNQIISTKETIKNLEIESTVSYEKTSNRIDEINKFYNRIYGGKDETGIETKGLKLEIENYNEELLSFQMIQKERYTALNKEIESLLPGATSAGLSSAYHSLSKSYDKSITHNTYLFYVSILILFIFSIILIKSNFKELTNLYDMGMFLVYRLPVVIPVVWLAVFASKRRSESERLKQEYAHKEALAKTYQSFKLQIEQLGENNQEPLLEKLLTAAIDTISNNASTTLDKKHGDSVPITDMIEKMVNKALDKLPNKATDE